MARTMIISVMAALLIAAAISVAAISPIDHQPHYLRAAATGVCYLDWPISKLTNRIDMSWQGLALFTEPQGCRGISPDMPRIFVLQGLWSTVVYVPLFVGFGTLAQRLRRRRAAL